jgi:cyclase
MSLTRRDFLTSTSCLGAALALARYFPLPALAESVAGDPRVAETPILDKGFAATRKIGEGVYATISDFSKGLQTMSNGGFLVGRDARLIIEGHRVPAGAAYEMEALRLVSKAPVTAAVDTHYHFDHSLGNAVYGAEGIPVWAHAQASPRMVERYASVQGQDKTAIFNYLDRTAALEPIEKRLRDASNESERQRAQSDLNLYQLMFDTVDSTVIALPSHPLDPAKLPLNVNLGGLTAVIESYPGHSGTDIIVRVPAQDIVFTGDLLFNGFYPATFEADMNGWRATLEKFAAFSKETLFVPGHGQLCGQEGVAGLQTVMDDLYQHALKSYKAGLPLAEAQKRYTVPPSLANMPVFSWAICIYAAIAKYYEQFGKAKR